MAFTMKRVLGAVAYATPGEPVTAQMLVLHLRGAEKSVASALHYLLPVLHISQTTGLIPTLHSSLSGYLSNAERSGDFYCNNRQCIDHRLIALRCFDLMRTHLRFNICDLRTSYLFDHDVPNLEECIHGAISSKLLYACQYWARHLLSVGFSDELCSIMVEFLSSCLLVWMEVLNLRGCIRWGVSMLMEVQDWLSVSGTCIPPILCTKAAPGS